MYFDVANWYYEQSPISSISSVFITYIVTDIEINLPL
jgi:hypothetical protein